MSTRSALVLSVISAVDTVLTAVSTSDIRLWEGEEEAFNPDAEYPLVYVEYGGLQFSENLERGADTRERIYRIMIHVLAGNSTDALNYLETIEDGISNTKLTPNSRNVYIDISDEQVARIWMKKFAYTQSYTATEMRSE